jgi:hypothetical protein
MIDYLCHIQVKTEKEPEAEVPQPKDDNVDAIVQGEITHKIEFLQKTFQWFQNQDRIITLSATDITPQDAIIPQITEAPAENEKPRGHPQPPTTSHDEELPSRTSLSSQPATTSTGLSFGKAANLTGLYDLPAELDDFLWRGIRI